MKEIITKYYNLYGLNDYDWDVWLSSVTYFIIIFGSYKLLEKFTPMLARLVYFWLWETPLLLGLIIFWTSLATLIILAILSYFIFPLFGIDPLLSEAFLYGGIFILGCSVFGLSKFHKETDGPHWYKFKYIKLNEPQQCAYRRSLTKQGLDHWTCYGQNDCRYCISQLYDN